MQLTQWGLDPAAPPPALDAGEILARIIEEQKTQYTVITEEGPRLAQLSGKFRRERTSRVDRPTVGDWVALRARAGEAMAIVQRVLPRASLLKRKSAGEDQSVQPLAANVDRVFIVTSMNRDFNARRLDRYLTIAHESGSSAAVLLTKSDLAPESAARAEDLARLHGVPCLALSALSGEGLAPLLELLEPKRTVVFVGSSGVGKSTLVNVLLGREEQHVAAVRESDDRGRHTTTSRRLLPLPNGALVIDTPGLREIQLSEDQAAGLEANFAAIEALAPGCRFSNCAHRSEPGCAVKRAVREGTLSSDQYESYLKLSEEIGGAAPPRGRRP